MLQSLPDRSATAVVTGALSFTGKYTTRVLLQRGYQVRTLTFHPNRENPFGERVNVFPYHFNEPDKLRTTLCGAFALINTYWVSSHAEAPHLRPPFKTPVS